MTTSFDLITRNLQEAIGTEDLKDILKTRPLRIYWGTATTGKPHIAYFLPILKIRDFLLADCEVKILLADIHAFLDNLKAPIEIIEKRSLYYEKVIKQMLISINVDISKLTFVRGSSFQKSQNYIFDLYKISTFTTDHDAKKAGSQVVKQVKNPLLSSMIYPAMQALDEEYLDVDAQFGGIDQRKIFTYAMKHLPMIGYKKRIHLMNPMVPGLNSEKMSASDIYSKIDLLEERKSIRKKINKCFCEEGNKENGIMYLIRYIILPILEIKKKETIIKRKDGDLNFGSYEELESLFVEKKIHPCDLKENVAEWIEEIIQPIRDEMLKECDLIEMAYSNEKKK